MASLVHKFRAARFRQAEASADALDVLLPPPLPLIHLPDEPRLARSGALDNRPMHLPVRRHLHPEQRTHAPEPNLHENRLLLDAEDQEHAARAVRERVRVYEYNQPQVPLEHSDSLVFDALFEGGNLQRADRVFREGVAPSKRHEYELWLHPDLKNSAYRQWFYFEVRNAVRGVVYQFSIVNLAKSGALFGLGLQPCVYSEIEAETRQRGWFHAGTHVRYDVSVAPDAPPGTNALHFQYEFPHDNDRVFFACLQPYSYTDLVEYLDKLELDPLRGAFVRRSELCQTIAQNACDLLSITGSGADALPPDDKKLIVVSARVHPGEPNASWMMKGMLDYLTSAASGAAVLRNHFVFKVVPMLNPDGVINGNTRVNLAGWDLNRKWSSPVEKLFPTVFHLKRLLANWQARDRVAVFCDLHGHSINRNIFTYGCFTRRANKKQNAAMNAAVNAATAAADASQSPPPSSGAEPARTASIHQQQPSVKNDPRVFPMIVAKNSEFFSFASCDFKVHKSKLNTARVVVHQELGVINSYTLEASFCGPDFGARKDTQFSTWDLEDMGRAWCQSLLIYFGLLPQVRALDKRREQENARLATATAAPASDATSASGPEPALTIVPPDDANLLELNGDLLSDCEAAISELFASVDFLDDAAGGVAAAKGDPCDSDLSGADEDGVPPNVAPDEDAGTAVKRPPVVNGYASAPEEYSRGDKAAAAKLKRRKSTRRKKSTNGASGAVAAAATPATMSSSGSTKKLSRKRKNKSRRRVEDQPECPEAPGDEPDDADGEGDAEADDEPERHDGNDDEVDNPRSGRRKKKKNKKKKPAQGRRHHHHHHRRRKDKNGSFRRVAPASDSECVASTATAGVTGDDAKQPISPRLLPDVPGSSCPSTRKPTPPSDEFHAPVARVELPVATPPQQPHPMGSRSGSRKQSKLVRIVSSEPLELPPVGGASASANHQQLYDLLAVASGSGRNVASAVDPKHKRPREPPYDDENDSDRSRSSSEDDDDASSASSCSSSSSSSEPRSALSDFW